MASAKEKPTLLSLPRELRDIIYEYTFNGDVPIGFHESFLRTENKLPRSGLPLVCQQLHSESIDAYYKHTTFVTLAMKELVSWLRSLPDSSRGSLQKVCHLEIDELYGLRDGDDVSSADRARLKKLETALTRKGIKLKDGVLTTRMH